MKKQIILASSIMLLACTVSALTIEEQVAANSIEIGLNSAAVQELTTNNVSLGDRVNELETMVTRLESYHNIRQFTIYGTSELDITVDGLKDQFASLNYQSGEFLYVKGVNSNSNIGICTSRQDAVNVINAYIEGTRLGRQLNNPSDLWYRAENNSSWNQAGYAAFSFYESTNQIIFYAHNSGYTESVSISVVPDYWDDDPYISGREISVNGVLDNESDNSITYKVASTRLDACGF